MEQYLFVLGRTPDLSVRELQAIGLSDGRLITPSIFQVERENHAEVRTAFDLLGGSSKLLHVVGRFHALSEESLPEYLAAYLAQLERPTFAIGEIGRDSLPKVQLSDVKSLLKARGVSSRFIEATREGLSAAVLLHQKVHEVVVVRTSPDEVLFGHTLAVQDIDAWTHRDRSKPYADRKKGMLPPKLARMMVNLAGPSPSISGTKRTVFDPFCGSGTVLLEAMMMGYDVIGSDLDAAAVAGTKQNTTWLLEQFDQKLSAHVFQADATRVGLEQLLGNPIDVIVTEPFLGKQTPQPEQLPNIFRGLEKMYLGAFRQWRKILADKAMIIIVMPTARAGKGQFSLESMIDKLATLGYTPISDPCEYYRPNAVIQRQIWTLEFRKQ